MNNSCHLVVTHEGDEVMSALVFDSPVRMYTGDAQTTIFAGVAFEYETALDVEGNVLTYDGEPVRIGAHLDTQGESGAATNEAIGIHDHTMSRECANCAHLDAVWQHQPARLKA